jgi:hypothetical protein
MVSFFDNIFYWFWSYTPSNGFPDRAFAIITVCQFSYPLLLFSIFLNVTDIDTQLNIYNNPVLFVVPLPILLIVCLVFNLIRYDEKRYNKIKRDFDEMFVIEKRKNRSVFFRFLLTTIVVIIVDSILIYLYISRMKSLL